MSNSPDLSDAGMELLLHIRQIQAIEKCEVTAVYVSPEYHEVLKRSVPPDSEGLRIGGAQIFWTVDLNGAERRFAKKPVLTDIPR